MSKQTPIFATQSHHTSDCTWNTQRYTPDSDDPCILEEAESLLSQFMGNAGQRPVQEIYASEYVVHGHTPFHRPPKRAANGELKAPMKWEEEEFDGDFKPIPPAEGPSDSSNASTPRHQSSVWSPNSASQRGPSNEPVNCPAAPPPESQRLPTTSHQPLNMDRPRRLASQSIAPPNISEPSYRTSGGQSAASPAPNGPVTTSDLSYQRTIPQMQARRSRRQKTEPLNYFPSIQFDNVDDDRYSSDRDITHTRQSGSRQSYHQQRQGAKDQNHGESKLNELIRRRELGYGSHRRLRSHISSDFELYKSWKGASNDVIVLAWSPSGTRFAAGATAQCDEHNMAYNRGNNLVLGDLPSNSLKELPDHWVPRPRGQAITDHRLFMSVSAVQWFEDTLLTASYDSTVKVWDAATHANARCLQTLRHDSKVDVMARSTASSDVLATGTQSSFGLWNIGEARYSALELVRPPTKKEVELMPTCLAWGTVSRAKELLVAGMSETEKDLDYGIPQHGLLAIWYADEDSMVPVQPAPGGSRNIFDMKWHPLLPSFAAASTMGQSRSGAFAKDARSVVRLYEPLSVKSHTIEFDCPALDVNDVTFCPNNHRYITASCTDGVTYVWDYRRPDQLVHKLKHGTPLNQMDENLPREQADVGVRLALWSDVDQFYTGASDGVLKQWNILRSPEDVLTQDVVHFQDEIMCGAFSEDKSNLLVGDDSGGVHVLSTTSPANLDMDFEPAGEPEQEQEQEPGDTVDHESGVGTANDLLSSKQLVRHPIYGVGQGSNYQGPFAGWARPEGTPRDKLASTPLIARLQALQLDGPAVADRSGLDSQARADIEAQIQLARIRNQQDSVSEAKRKRDDGRYVNLVSEEEDIKPILVHKKKKKKKKRSKKSKDSQVITNLAPGVIDLTMDVDTNADKRRLEELDQELQEDFWWPESGTIDPNMEDPDT